MPLPILDHALAEGFQGGAGWATSQVTTAGGRKTANQMWVDPIHTYSFAYATRKIEDCRAIKSFHIGRRGKQGLWLLYDHADNAVENEQIGIGDGSETDFQATITYDDDDPYVRTIRYLQSGTLSVTVNGVTATVSNETDGLITLASPPANGAIVRASFGFYVPVRFTTDDLFIEVSGPGGIYGRIAGLGAEEALP